jgi:adenosine deaminase
MSDTTVTSEYAHAAAAHALTLDELCAMARTGFEYAFLPEAEGRALLGRVDAAIRTLRDAAS